MTKQIAITINDYNRLIHLMDLSDTKAKSPDIAIKLHSKISGARTFSQENIDSGVVTMNSRVHLKDLKNGWQTEITLTYPHEAEPRDRRVSVLSEIGVALIGHQEKEVVSWRVPGGTGQFEIIKVTYQPEAEGHYYL
jgi:regulator of nucleoside diphosphate kinase